MFPPNASSPSETANHPIFRMLTKKAAQLGPWQNPFPPVKDLPGCVALTDVKLAGRQLSEIVRLPDNVQPERSNLRAIAGYSLESHAHWGKTHRGATKRASNAGN